MRRIGSALLAVVVVLLFAACGNKSEIAINLDDTVKAVFDAAGFSEELVKQDDATIAHSYPTLELDKVETFAVYVSGSSATPEEFAIFQAKTEEDAKSVLKAVERRVEDLTINFEDYRPEEMPKIEHAVTLSKGTYVMLAICPNYEAVGEILNRL